MTIKVKLAALIPSRFLKTEPIHVDALILKIKDERLKAHIQQKCKAQADYKKTVEKIYACSYLQQSKSLKKQQILLKQFLIDGDFFSLQLLLEGPYCQLDLQQAIFLDSRSSLIFANLSDGIPPLFQAFRLGHFEMVKLLLLWFKDKYKKAYQNACKDTEKGGNSDLQYLSNYFHGINTLAKTFSEDLKKGGMTLDKKNEQAALTFLSLRDYHLPALVVSKLHQQGINLYKLFHHFLDKEILRLENAFDLSFFSCIKIRKQTKLMILKELIRNPANFYEFFVLPVDFSQYREDMTPQELLKFAFERIVHYKPTHDCVSDLEHILSSIGYSNKRYEFQQSMADIFDSIRIFKPMHKIHKTRSKKNWEEFVETRVPDAGIPGIT